VLALENNGEILIETITAKLCECGCGGAAPIAPQSIPKRGVVKGQPTRFIAGHQTQMRLPDEEIKRLYLEGRSTKAIGVLFGINYGTVRLHLLQMGVKLRSRFAPATRQEQIRLFWESVEKKGPIPKPDSSWTPDQELNNFWKWDGKQWEWAAGPCWLWTGLRNPAGYGLFQIGGKFLAHRFAWMLHHNIWKIPKGIEIMHECDNPPCIRPEHTSAGSHDENMAAMASRNRSGQLKLSDEQVVEIRNRFADGESIPNIANRFSVDQSNIHLILRGKSRAKVGGPLVSGRILHLNLHLHRRDISTQQIIHLYIGEGRGLPEVARQLGCSIATVQRRLIKAGYSTRPLGTNQFSDVETQIQNRGKT
jgi:DNA-binding CsgD family transcriptional regulator